MRMYQQTVYIYAIMQKSRTRRRVKIAANQRGSFDIKFLMIYHNAMYIRLIITVIIIVVVVSIISHPQKLELLLQSNFPRSIHVLP